MKPNAVAEFTGSYMSPVSLRFLKENLRMLPHRLGFVAVTRQEAQLRKTAPTRTPTLPLFTPVMSSQKRAQQRS